MINHLFTSEVGRSIYLGDASMPQVRALYMDLTHFEAQLSEQAPCPSHSDKKKTITTSQNGGQTKI